MCWLFVVSSGDKWRRVGNYRWDRLDDSQYAAKNANTLTKLALQDTIRLHLHPVDLHG